MRFRCERDIFLEALSTTSRAATTKVGFGSFGGVRIELKGSRAHLAGTDMELTIQTSAAVEAGTEGVAVLPGRLAADIVRAFNQGVVTVEATEEEASFSCGRSQFTVKLFPADDFPVLPRPTGEPVTVGARLLGDALHQVVRAASSDETKPLLTGVLLSEEPQGLRIVATDSYRLAIRDLSGTSVLSQGSQVLVPARALGELQRVLVGASEGENVTFWLGSTDATFEMGPVVITTRLLSGKFPDYQKLIPESYTNKVLIGKEALVEAMKRMKLLIKDIGTPVRMALRDDGVVLTVITPDLGQGKEDLDATYTGTEMTVAFNPNYLIDGVEAVATDEVILETIDSTKPATIRPSQGDDFRYLLMPVRVS